MMLIAGSIGRLHLSLSIWAASGMPAPATSI